MPPPADPQRAVFLCVCSFVLGEGIVKKEADLAAEVEEQTKAFEKAAADKKAAAEQEAATAPAAEAAEAAPAVKVGSHLQSTVSLDFLSLVSFILWACLQRPHSLQLQRPGRDPPNALSSFFRR